MEFKKTAVNIVMSYFGNSTERSMFLILSRYLFEDRPLKLNRFWLLTVCFVAILLLHRVSWATFFLDKPRQLLDESYHSVIL